MASATSTSAGTARGANVQRPGFPERAAGVVGPEPVLVRWARAAREVATPVRFSPRKRPSTI